MKKYVELNELQKFCRRYTEVDAVGLILAERTDLLHTVQAISLDKIKQAREEIKEKAFIEEVFDEGIFNSTNTESVSRETAECESYVETEVVRLSNILEILDKLIAESEG